MKKSKQQDIYDMEKLTCSDKRKYQPLGHPYQY